MLKHDTLQLQGYSDSILVVSVRSFVTNDCGIKHEHPQSKDLHGGKGDQEIF